MTAIVVTAGHIAAGNRSPWGCAVALALREAFPDATEICVGTKEFDIETPGLKVTAEVLLPLEATQFIYALDAHRAVEPFSFTVDYPAVTA
jgi:hypothetical protein